MSACSPLTQPVGPYRNVAVGAEQRCGNAALDQGRGQGRHGKRALERVALAKLDH